MNNATTYTSARQNFKSILDEVCKNYQPILIKRRKGGNVVILSEEDFHSLDETAYLNTSPANRKHLLESLHQLKTGVIEVSLKDL